MLCLRTIACTLWPSSLLLTREKFVIPYVKLLSLYQQQGFQVRVGLNPLHFADGHRDLPFCCLYKNGRPFLTGGGISVQEIYFFESLFHVHPARNIFIVGNAFGWSTLLMALCNPKAHVVAIDSAVEGDDAMAGVRLTEAIIQQEGLRASVFLGTSPHDVPQATAQLPGAVDFAFIDGLHTNDQQAADFNAILPVAHPNCIFVFHDVVNWNLQPGFNALAYPPHYQARILYRTPSGMGILYPKNLSIPAQNIIAAFTQEPYVLPAQGSLPQSPPPSVSNNRHLLMNIHEKSQPPAPRKKP